MTPNVFIKWCVKCAVAMGAALSTSRGTTTRGTSRDVQFTNEEERDRLANTHANDSGREEETAAKQDGHCQIPEKDV